MSRSWTQSSSGPTQAAGSGTRAVSSKMALPVWVCGHCVLFGRAQSVQAQSVLHQVRIPR